MEGIDEYTENAACTEDVEALARENGHVTSVDGDDASPDQIAAIQEMEDTDETNDAAVPAAPPSLEPASNLRPLVSPSGEMSDWVQCTNADGDTFYCNLETRATSWAAPFELPSLVSSARLSSHEESLHSFPSEMQHTVAEDGAAERSDGAGVAQADAQTARGFAKRVLEGTLRRLDPHTQLQLEEARRRHHEMEELRDAEVLMGGEHWVEMFDPTHDGFYYYGVRSGEMRWDRPDSYVMKVESDDVLRIVVRLQCVFRMKLARRKVFQLKLQRGLVSGGLEGATTNPWVEVYDPFHKVLYYFCVTSGETRWDPPEHFISAAEDREMAAAIAIQSVSRSHLARREVKKRKTTIRKKQHELAVEETRRLREIRRREYSAKTDHERESISRREMLEEETEQIRDGDLFWGLDRHDQEVVRQLMEEKLLADAERFWQRVNLTLRLRVEMEMQRSHEDETLRLENVRVLETNERDRMRAAETRQCCLGDGFWGIEAEESSERGARHDMDDEDRRSREFGACVLVDDQVRAWEEEREARVERDKTNKAVNERTYQQQYFKWFYGQCETADDVLDYPWPAHKLFDPASVPGVVENQQDEPLVEQENHERNNSSLTPSKPIAHGGVPYLLDDVILRERLETDFRYGGKSIYTIHDPATARIQCRCGQYMVSHVSTDAVYTRAAKKADANPRQTSPTRPMLASYKQVPNDTEPDEDERIRLGMFPSLHTRHSKIPDPHLPARYNGVPYRLSEMSETREILTSHHTRLTQIPSLTKPSPKKTTSKSKAKANDPSRKKTSSFALAMQASNNNTFDPLTSSLGFASPFYREAQVARQESLRVALRNKETNEERNAHGAQDQAQCARRRLAARFEKEELAAVRDVFLAMDLDGSGAINKLEMVWALQRDSEVHAIAKQSALLRLLLKQQSHIEELFTHLRMSGAQHEETSWDSFRIFCEELYISLRLQGVLDAAVEQSSANAKLTMSAAANPVAVSAPPKAVRTRKGSVYEERNEEKLIRCVFALCDQDSNGVLEVDELQRALHATSNPELERLVRTSIALQPLLHQDTFVDAFRKFESLDPRGISEEEFVVFCLESADIAMLNGML